MGAPLGNTNSRKENRIVRDTLKRVAAQNSSKLRLACEKLLDKAVEGDVTAFKEFRDTLDGRPIQMIAGDDENPLNVIHKIERVIVNAKDQDS